MSQKGTVLIGEDEGIVDVINVKCEPDMVGFLTQTYGFYQDII